MQEVVNSRRERVAEGKNNIDKIDTIDKIDLKDEEIRYKIIKKVNIWLLKVLPMVISAMYLLHTGLSLTGREFPPLRYLGGISLIPLTYIYISSFVFKFCVYHRLFLYYIFLYNIIKIANYYLMFPTESKTVIWLDLGIAGMFIFMLLYLRFEVCRR